MNWKDKAKRLLGNRTIHIEGDGQFALVTPCRTRAFSLWPTRAEAKQAKNSIESCGGDCHRVSSHYIADLPSALARFRPAFTRSTIMLRSNSATTSSI